MRHIIFLPGVVAILLTVAPSVGRADPPETKKPPEAKKVNVGKNITVLIQGDKRSVQIDTVVCLREGRSNSS